MTLFYKTFVKIFAILSSISIFIITLLVLSSFLTKIENERIFINTYGDINSQNKIAILKLTGPILNNPNLISDYKLFSNVNIIYINKTKIFALGGISEKNIQKLKLLKIKGFGGINLFKKKPASKRPVFIKNNFF